MGVPGLFANLKNKYPKIVKKIVNNIENSSEDLLNDILEDNIVLKPYVLFFDFNCIIHPIVHLLWKTYSYLNNKEFEEKIMSEVMKYTKKIIEYSNVQNSAYIFIDGVCPYSKMVQQRQRRLASIIDKNMINDVREKNGLPQQDYYDTNSITPGTEFMENFNYYIINFVKEWNENLENKVKLNYSSYHEPGEGEHKIINYIKENDEILKDQEILIYGLDADLIILSLTLTKQFNIKLLREKEEVSLEHFKMIIFDVNECAKSIIYELSNEKIYENYYLDENYRYVDDFIFMTILLGNDFLPSNPTVNMKFRNKYVQAVQGYDLLIDMYKEVKGESDNNTFLTLWKDKRFIVNWQMYKCLIDKMVKFEQQYFETVRNRYNNMGNKTGVELDIDMINCLAFKEASIDPLKMYAKYLNYENCRKKRFVHHYFGKKVCSCIDKDGINYGSQLCNDNMEIDDKFYDSKTLTINEIEYDNMIKKYLLTMGYIMYYYYTGCPNNMYFYSPCSGILLSDLSVYLEKHMDELKTIHDYFLNRRIKQIYPIQQLLIVLPKKSFKLISKKIDRMFDDDYKDDDSNTNLLIKYYKKNYLKEIKLVKRDYLNKTKLYQSTIIMKIPRLYMIDTLLSNMDVTDKEISRFF